MTSDFLVTIGFFGGGVWGRADSKDKALKIALKELKATAEGLGLKLKPHATLDYGWLDLTGTGIEQVQWDTRNTYLDGRPMTDNDVVSWQSGEVTL